VVSRIGAPVRMCTLRRTFPTILSMGTPLVKVKIFIEERVLASSEIPEG
jgi:hypothetical protein